MKKILIFMIIFTIPVFIISSVYQTFKYEKLLSDIKKLENIQKDWLEYNKKITSAIAVLGSPSRIDYIAKEKLGLSHASGKIIKINIVSEKAGVDG